MVHARITGCGSYLPSKTVTNKDLEATVDTNDAWIAERTGISERHIAADEEFASDLGAKAAQNAMKQAGIGVQDIDLIIVATTTPDKIFPSTAAIIQDKLGVKQGAAFDIQAVCSGFVYGLATANNFIKAGQAKNVLVIGTETMSRIVDWEDRGTCILFGDGAGAFVVSAEEDTKSKSRILSTHLYSDGGLGTILETDAGIASGQLGKIRMNGREVFKHATHKMAEAVDTALLANDLSLEDVTWLIPHQANIRIMQAVGKRLGLPEERVIATVSGHANTSAASIPLACDQAIREGKLSQGDLVVMTALGGGLTWGSAALYW